MGLRPQNKREDTKEGSQPLRVLELAAQKLTRQEIADQTGIGIASVYRILSAAKQEA
jgi:DNA invertase Pin-like site-specific DNA recombinase